MKTTLLIHVTQLYSRHDIVCDTPRIAQDRTASLLHLAGGR